MATPIYVCAKEIAVSDAKKASSCLENAISDMKKVDDAVSGWDLYIDAAADGFVFSDSESEIGACLSELRTKQTQLDKLIAAMQTGTEKLEDADDSFKRKLTDSDQWERLADAAKRAVYSAAIGKAGALMVGAAWLRSLFVSESKEAVEITYRHLIGQYDWSKTKLSEEDVKEIINTERKLAEIKGVRLTEQRTRELLQTVYDEQTKEPSEYEKYRALVEKANTAEPGEKQKDDLCTFASMATMLRRKQAVEGKTLTFTRDSVRAKHPKGLVYAHAYEANESTYNVKTDTAPLTSERMRELLDKHPEGVWVYDENIHAIVITDYEINEDGAICFFADDPVNNAYYELTGRVRLESTWFYKDRLKCSNPESFFSTIDRICYIE